MSDILNRGTGLLVLNVVNSNPNGDPDAESDPRMYEDGRGLISPVSYKRKLRDLMEMDGPVAKAALEAVGPMQGVEILESRGRDRKAIGALPRAEFMSKFWDGRIFGNTFVEKSDGGKNISTGVVQFGPGLSVAPLEIVRLTMTNKAGVEDGKDRGMAPLAFRVVRHAVYVMPFFANPSAASKSGCDEQDVELLKFLIPHAYSHTASAMRAQVDVVHAWYAEHKTPLGSCPDPLLLEAMTPRKREAPNRASTSLAEYDVPQALPDALMDRLSSFEDLVSRDWARRKAA